MSIDLKALREIVEKVVQNPDSVDGMADFVATFAPPMMLALLDRLEAVEQLAEQRAALGALASAGRAVLNEMGDTRRAAMLGSPPIWLSVIQELEEALASGAVQQAAARLKELERIEQVYYHPDEHGLIDLAETEAEAKLVVAIGLLKQAEWVGGRCFSCYGWARHHWKSCQLESFLADPSRATAQYREALAVVERVKDLHGLSVLLYRFYYGEMNATQAQKYLLGEAVERVPDTPTGGVADVQRLAQLVQETS